MHFVKYTSSERRNRYCQLKIEVGIFLLNRAHLEKINIKFNSFGDFVCWNFKIIFSVLLPIWEATYDNIWQNQDLEARGNQKQIWEFQDWIGTQTGIICYSNRRGRILVYQSRQKSCILNTARLFHKRETGNFRQSYYWVQNFQIFILLLLSIWFLLFDIFSFNTVYSKIEESVSSMSQKSVTGKNIKTELFLMHRHKN